MAAKRSVTSGTRNKQEATTAPVKAVGELITHWDRDFAIAGVEVTGGYRRLTIEVVSRANNVISFNILDSSGKGKKVKAGGAYTINLDDGLQAWSDLPSTAQFVDPESTQRIGYLFVTPEWLGRNKIDTKLMEGPNKWPRLASL
jgi:hypothetical protein